MVVTLVARYICQVAPLQSNDWTIFDRRPSGIMSNEWILESVEAFLGSPMWTAPILTFIESNCHEFTDCEENKLVYTTVHKDYSKLVDALVGNFLGDLGVTLQQFEEAYQQIPSSSNRKQALTDQLLSVNNFIMFKNMMVQTNMRIQREVLSLRNSLPRATSVPAQPAGVLATESVDDDEDEVLRLALELSRREFLQAKQGTQAAPSGGDVVVDEEYQRALRLSVMDDALQRERTEQTLLEQAMQMSLQDSTSVPQPVEDKRSMETSPSVTPELSEVAVASGIEQEHMATPVPPKVNYSSNASTHPDCNTPGALVVQLPAAAAAPRSARDSTTSVPDTSSIVPANESGQRVTALPELLEACVQDAGAAPANQAAEVDGDMTAKVEERTQHLQALRQRLVSKKRVVRQAGLASYTSSSGQTTRPKSAQVAKSATALGSLPPIPGQMAQADQQFSQSLSAFLQQPDAKQRRKKK